MAEEEATGWPKRLLLTSVNWHGPLPQDSVDPARLAQRVAPPHQRPSQASVPTAGSSGREDVPPPRVLPTPRQSATAVRRTAPPAYPTQPPATIFVKQSAGRERWSCTRLQNLGDSVKLVGVRRGVNASRTVHRQRQQRGE